MTIDIHELLEKNSITRNIIKPKFGYKYLGTYNPLDKQLLYDKQTEDIYICYDKLKNVLDKIASRHDTCYAVGKKTIVIGLWLKKSIIYHIIEDLGVLML